MRRWRRHRLRQPRIDRHSEFQCGLCGSGQHLDLAWGGHCRGQHDGAADRLRIGRSVPGQHPAGEISTGLGGSKYYWTGSSYTSNQTWITTTTANPWFYTLPVGALANGLYYVRVQATDFALNQFTSLTSTFTWNNSNPSVTITPQVPNNGFYSAVQVSTPLAGTATPAAVSGVVISTVTLTLRDLTAGTSYFNGSAWQSGLITFPAQGPASGWSFNSAGLVFVNDHQYR